MHVHLVIVRLKLKSRYKGRVEAAFDYTKTINDFDELVDACTLYCHFLGPEPSPYVLRSLLREKQSKYLPWQFITLTCGSLVPYL